MLALGIGLLSLYNADVPCSQVSFLPVCLSVYLLFRVLVCGPFNFPDHRYSQKNVPQIV